MTRPLAAALAALLVLPPAAAQAADVVIGLGYSDFNDARADDSAILELELHSDPIWHFAGADWSIAGAVVAHARGDVFVGAGPAAIWQMRNRWFVEASVMPGHFDAASGANSLGSDFEIRSLLGIGRAIGEGTSLSLAITHKSNAGSSSSGRNPGVNALSLRLRRSF
ncbi:acyloxyacyl hydrolase [Albidovulum sp.]